MQGCENESQLLQTNLEVHLIPLSSASASLPPTTWPETAIDLADARHLGLHVTMYMVERFCKCI